MVPNWSITWGWSENTPKPHVLGERTLPVFNSLTKIEEIGHQAKPTTTSNFERRPKSHLSQISRTPIELLLYGLLLPLDGNWSKRERKEETGRTGFAHKLGRPGIVSSIITEIAQWNVNTVLLIALFLEPIDGFPSNRRIFSNANVILLSRIRSDQQQNCYMVLWVSSQIFNRFIDVFLFGCEESVSSFRWGADSKDWSG